MQRKFLTNLIFLLCLNLLVKPFWIFGIDRTVQNTVGAEQYGFYFAILNFSFLFNILLDLGITNFNNRNIAQNNQLLNKHFSGIATLKIILSLIYAIITFSFGLIIGYNSYQLFLLAVLGFNQFLLSFITYLRSNISGLQLYRTDSVLSTLDRFLMIIICSILLWGNITQSKFRIEWFIYAQTLSYIITGLIVLFIVIKKAKISKFRWNWAFYIMIIKRSFPFALLILLMTFYNKIDSIMLERILPDSKILSGGKILHGGDYYSGIYASAYRLLDASNMIAYLFAVLLLPMFSRMLKNKESVEELVKLSSTILLTFTFIIAIGSFFYSKDLMNLMYHEHISESSDVFRLIMWCLIGTSSTYIFGTLLTANGSLKTLNIIASGGMILNILLNIFLIPRLYAVGSAYASLTTQLLTALAQIIAVQYIFKFNINYKFLFNLLSFFIIVIMINILSRQLHTEWKINFMIMITISLLSAFILKLLDIKSLIKIIRTN